jgi:hypothetical protein
MLGPPGPSVPASASAPLRRNETGAARSPRSDRPSERARHAGGEYVPERAPGPVVTVPVLDPTELLRQLPSRTGAIGSLHDVPPPALGRHS